MAVRNVTDLPGQLRSTDRIPPTSVVLRAIKETFAPSKSSGNPMITREWEVVAPETVMVNGTAKFIAGLKLQQYLPTMSLNPDGSRNDAKSDKALARLRDENIALRLPADAIDDENPELHIDLAIKANQPIYADGKIDADAYELRNPPTPEQLAQGIKVGSPKLGADGKPEQGFRVKLSGIYGRASGEIGKTYGAQSLVKQSAGRPD